MNKPKTYRELIELVSPQDLLDVLDFSGRNDKPGNFHWTFRRGYSHQIYESIKDYRRKEPRMTIHELNDDFYDTIIKCIQDFYWWSRQFNHSHAHIYKRVINALDIPMEEII